MWLILHKEQHQVQHRDASSEETTEDILTSLGLLTTALGDSIWARSLIATTTQNSSCQLGCRTAQKVYCLEHLPAIKGRVITSCTYKDAL